MKTFIVVNLSHPLSAAALEVLEDMTGRPVEEIRVPVQVDFGAPLAPQITALAGAAREAAPHYNAIVPPGHGTVAALLMRRLTGPVVVIARTDTTPPQYLPTEVIL